LFKQIDSNKFYRLVAILSTA